MFMLYMPEGPAVVRIKKNANRNQEWTSRSKAKKQTIRTLRQAKNSFKNKLLG